MLQCTKAMCFNAQTSANMPLVMLSQNKPRMNSAQQWLSQVHMVNLVKTCGSASEYKTQEQLETIRTDSKHFMTGPFLMGILVFCFLDFFITLLVCWFCAAD